MVTYPKDWKIFDLGDILEFKNGLNKGKAYFGHGTPIVNYMDVYKKNGLRSNDINGSVSLSRDEIRRFEAKKNDVFFTRTSETPEEVGISAVLLDEIPDCVFSGFVLRGRPKMEGLSPEYCQYCFGAKEFRNEIIKHCTYTTRALTNGKILSAIKIPLPPLAEQKAIAATLSSFDTHIDNLTALIEKKKAIRDGALADLMSGRTRLAGFSGAWELRRIRDIGNIITGSTPPRGNSNLWNGDFCWVTARDLKGKYVSTTFEKITSVGKEYCRTVPKGSVLVTCIASIGLNGIATVSLATNQQINSVICYDEYHSEFVYYCIEYNRPRLEQMAGQTAVPIVSKKQFGGLEVDIPANLDEQKAIADILASMDTEIQNLEAERDKIQAMREGAMDDLLTGRVRLPL